VAKLVLLEIADDEKADQLISMASGDRGFIPDVTGALGFEIKVQLRGVFKWPTQFCECPPETRDTSGTSRRGAKFGWGVKSCCNKPGKGVGQQPVNLLEGKEWPDRNFFVIGTPGKIVNAVYESRKEPVNG